jgi:hypothetical protein
LHDDETGINKKISETKYETLGTTFERSSLRQILVEKRKKFCFFSPVSANHMQYKVAASLQAYPSKMEFYQLSVKLRN